MKPIKQLLTHFNTKTAMGKSLNKSKQSISGYGDYLPPKQAIQAEYITNGKFKAVDLVNPDIFDDLS